MGQGYSLHALPPGPSAFETPELSDLTFEKPLGAARLLRTVRAAHQDGVVVAKVCQKNSPTDSLKRYVKALKEERRSLRGIPNVLPYERIRETATLGILVRQFINTSLYDRVSIRPFLENIEKKWIAFQLLCAVRDCHARGVFHGDIKSENVLVTSWEWLYLTDFASTYKPVYLPEDNPHDFSIYYDSSGRRTCYLAPERFYAPGERPSDPHVVQWNMDIFSVGCVIAELFTETPLFDLSQLFKYRKGAYDPSVALLNKVEDEHVRSLINSMIRLNPEERWHAQDYLDEHKGKAFPLYFYQHLHTLMQEITYPSPVGKPTVTGHVNNGQSDNRLDRIYDDFDMLSISLGYEPINTDQKAALPKIGTDLFPLQVDLPNDRHSISDSSREKDDNGSFILLNVVTAAMRSTARATSKVRACELLLAFAERLPDEAKLDRILPYIMPLLTDDSSEIVLVAALRTMTQILALVRVTSPANSLLFTQYIFPRLQTFVSSNGFRQHPIVRATYATCLASLAETASRFLDIMQALRVDEAFRIGDRALHEDRHNSPVYQEVYDVTRSEVLEQFEGQTKVFLTDNDSTVHRAFLTSVPTLCVFFGEARANDVILSHLNTYLNDPDWQLKCAFFKTMVGVSVIIGGASLEEFILPLMMQALTDPQEFVIEQTLRSLASMAEIGLLQRAKTWQLIDSVARFEFHPNMWIREAASHFIAAASRDISLADVRILVTPLVMSYVKVPVADLSESELLDALKKPLPRAVLDLAVQWAGSVNESSFWKQAQEFRQRSNSSLEHMPPVSSTAALGPRSLAKIPKTDEDEQWLGRLRNAGMRGEDEVKILALRDYLWRVGQKVKTSKLQTETFYERIVSLTKLKITPQTVMFDNDPEAYTEHIRDLNAALSEATQEGRDHNDGDGTAEESNGDLSYAPGSANLMIPRLKRQTSGSGQSLSSSPGSGLGFLGNHGERKSADPGNVPRIEDNRNKARPEVATDDAVAAGKIHTSSSQGKRHSREASGNTRKMRDVRSDQRVAHSYTGNDPTVLKLLDTVYVDNFPLNASEFGPLIQPLKRGIIPSTSSQSTLRPWRPKGQLIGILGEHSARVNRIAVSPDHLFVLTASDDGTVKVWDASRFERNITHRSRATYHLGVGVRVTDLCFIDSTHTFIATGSDGSVRVVKVDASTTENGTTFKIGKTMREWGIPLVSSNTTEYAICCEHYRSDSGSTLLLATSIGRLIALDLRTMRVLFELHNPPQHGRPTCMCLGKRHDWVLVGSTHGVIDLWDLRFQNRLRSWAFPAAVPITRLQLLPSVKSTRRQRVGITGGTGPGEVSVWDLEKLICHEVYRPLFPGAKEERNGKDYELKSLDDDRSEKLLGRVAGVINLEPTTPSASAAVGYFGVYQTTEDAESQQSFVITGGPDGKVRFWEADHLENCMVVSGIDVEEAPPSFTVGVLGLDTTVVSEKSSAHEVQDGKSIESNKVTPSSGTSPSTSSNVKNARYGAIRLAAQNLFRGHLDSITEVTLLERPFGIILSADRSGQVFAYQ